MILEIIPVKIKKEIERNTDIIDLVLESTIINDYDILIFSQKIISKNEGRIVDYLLLILLSLLVVLLVHMERIHDW